MIRVRVEFPLFLGLLNRDSRRSVTKWFVRANDEEDFTLPLSTASILLLYLLSLIGRFWFISRKRTYAGGFRKREAHLIIILLLLLCYSVNSLLVIKGEVQPVLLVS